MKRDDHQRLRRMLRAARETRIEPAEAPFGFANRVAARWAKQSAENDDLALWERWCGRAAGLTAVAAVLVGLAVWQTWAPSEQGEDAAIARQITELALF